MTSKERSMNKDQGEVAVKDKGGKTQQKAGRAAGSSDKHAKGVAKQSEVRMQKASDNVKASLKNSRHL
jgi:uncharacterized protein YjbJ (UPF0337 family)